MLEILKLITRKSDNISSDIEINKSIVKGILKRDLIKNKILNKTVLNNNKLMLISKNNLQRVNQINNWMYIVYKYSKDNLIDRIILNKTVSLLLERLLTYNIYNTSKINKKRSKRSKRKEIIISSPVIKENNNSVLIQFYYHIKLNKFKKIRNEYYRNIWLKKFSIKRSINSLYYNTSVNKLFNLLNMNDIKKIEYSLNKILSYYYNKKVIISPIYLKYPFNNSEIFLKSLNKKNRNVSIKKFYENGLNKRLITKSLNNLPIFNSLSISSIVYKHNYNNYNTLYNNSKTSLIKNNGNINYMNIYNKFNHNYLDNLLLYKYLSGYNFIMNTKTHKVSRTAEINISKGTLSLYNNSLSHNFYTQHLFKYPFKLLNKNLSNINTHLTHNLSKKGTYSTSITFNYL